MFIYFPFLLYFLFATVEVFMCNNFLFCLFIWRLISYSSVYFNIYWVYFNAFIYCLCFVHLIFNLVVNYVIYLHYLFLYLSIIYFILYLLNKFILFYLVWVSQVQGLAMGWTVRKSNPGGVRSSAPVQIGPVTHPASCTIGSWSLSRW